jgi:hypothetical protein
MINNFFPQREVVLFTKSKLHEIDTGIDKKRSIGARVILGASFSRAR